MLVRIAMVALLGACGPRARGPLENQAPAHAPPRQTSPEVTAVGDYQWRVAVTCEYAGARRTAAALVFLTAPTAAVPAPFSEIAAADGWLLVAKDHMKAERYPDAIVAARQGLDQLGTDYRAPEVRDDTSALIAEGDASVEQALAFGGATKLVIALESRIYMATVRQGGRVLRDVPLDE